MNAIRTARQLRPVLALPLAAALAAGCVATRPDEDARERRDPNVVDSEDLRGRALARVQDMLRGQVAGVEVRDTPRGLKIRIRGASSFYASTDPLFIIDGLPLTFGDDGVLVGIAPQDIATLRVLKNASETAAYGMRGANGVVLITTKRAAVPADTTVGQHRGWLTRAGR